MIPPKFPKSTRLPGRALKRLAIGERITHRSFQNQTSSYRLSHFIFKLRENGWPVQTIEKIATTNDPVGRNATYAEYFILPEDLKKLKNEMGERLDKFIDAVKHFESGVPGGGNQGDDNA